MSGKSLLIAAILLAATLLRGIVAVEYEVPLESDALGYHVAAATLVETGTMLQRSDAAEYAVNTPGAPQTEPLHNEGLGFPAFLTPFYYLFGPEGEAPKTASLIALAVLGGLLVPCAAMFLYRLLSPGGHYTIAVAASTAFWPETIVMGRHLLSENLTVVLLTVWMLCCVALLRANRPTSWGVPILMALSGGWLFLTRPETLPVIFVMFAVLAFRARATGSGLPMVRLIVATAILVPALIYPSIRSVHYFHEWIPLTAGGGYAVMDAANQTQEIVGANRALVHDSVVPGKPKQTDSNLYRHAVEKIRQRPVYYLQGCAFRLVRMFFFPFGEPAVRGRGPALWIARLALTGSRMLLAVTAIAGGFLLFRRSRILCLAVAPVFFFIAVLHSIYWGEPRFLVPTIPIALTLSFFWLENRGVTRAA